MASTSVSLYFYFIISSSVYLLIVQLSPTTGSCEESAGCFEVNRLELVNPETRVKRWTDRCEFTLTGLEDGRKSNT